MNDRITSFKLNWYDCGLCCVDDTVQEEVVVSRNDKLLLFKELNGYGVIHSCETINIESAATEKFFTFLENICDEWKNDYGVEICDGSEWQIRMWHSSHKVTKICGTIEYPPHGKKIERHLRALIKDGNHPIFPKFFGCR